MIETLVLMSGEIGRTHALVQRFKHLLFAVATESIWKVNGKIIDDKGCEEEAATREESTAHSLRHILEYRYRHKL